ncbi:pterin-4-alpha-carbinolamine dehydratase isoform X2 [Anastrepha ludens]|uniref:pterin-4-alpha-carbinolamine dehydratase isoform X2 n=1 Tax=Anastrepha ludens TaxID=28586 RepID=UPI0023B0856E|nr:pterin-4-alpha-carbinolamine dehydratase isoform X2 [Anastrepha ludens]
MIFPSKLLRIYKTSKLFPSFKHVGVSVQQQFLNGKDVGVISVDCSYLSRRYLLLCTLPKAVRTDTFGSDRQYSTVITQNRIPTKKKMAKLTEQERSEHLQPFLDAGWSLVDGGDAAYKEYLFKDFNEAFSFMTGVAMVAEKWNHHPEWSNVYNKVQVKMSTHDAGGLTMKDISMMKYMEARVKCF